MRKKRELPEGLIEDYKNGLSGKAIIIKYKIKWSTAKEFLVEAGVHIRDGHESKRIYHVNHSYFKEINDERKAYWLGFLYADGNVWKNKLQLGLSNTDRDHIETFKGDLQSNHPIHKNRSCVGIHIHSNELTDDLIKHGCVRKKTFLIKPPKIKEELIRHFIRGFFDGDGCITHHKPKGEKKFHYYIQFSSTKSFCEWLLDKIKKDCNIKIGNVYKERRLKTDCSYVTIASTKQEHLEKFYHYIYTDATVYLDRKKQKFEFLRSYNKI